MKSVCSQNKILVFTIVIELLEKAKIKLNSSWLIISMFKIMQEFFENGNKKKLSEHFYRNNFFLIVTMCQYF